MEARPTQPVKREKPTRVPLFLQAAAAVPVPVHQPTMALEARDSLTRLLPNTLVAVAVAATTLEAKEEVLRLRGRLLHRLAQQTLAAAVLG
jgi:nitrate reductase assembly molybdenum cofactor insertion protein NarJ